MLASDHPVRHRTCKGVLDFVASEQFLLADRSRRIRDLVMRLAARQHQSIFQAWGGEAPTHRESCR